MEVIGIETWQASGLGSGGSWSFCPSIITIVCPYGLGTQQLELCWPMPSSYGWLTIRRPLPKMFLFRYLKPDPGANSVDILA